MPGFLFLASESHFVARHPGGGASVELAFPGDFPGEVGLAADLQAEIQSITVDLTTSAVAANRRVRLELFTTLSFSQVLWYSLAQQAASITARRFQFTRPGIEVQVAGLLNKEILPMMVMSHTWALRVDINNAQAGDIVENVIVQGEYLPRTIRAG